MKIAIIGYGKMGREIEKLALEKEYEILAILDNEADWQKYGHSLNQAEVAIEFTSPGIAPDNIRKCFQANIPVVSGTTGWYDQLPEISTLCMKGGHALFYAPNFSLGVNIFFELNRFLARMMASVQQYRVSISETHHVQKIDAPSGTAIKLANDIIDARPDVSKWVLKGKEKDETGILIEALRLDQVPGTHLVSYQSDNDQINIEHVAHGRRGFSEGALMAAGWIRDKKGVFTMKDLFNF